MSDPSFDADKPIPAPAEWRIDEDTKTFSAKCYAWLQSLDRKARQIIGQFPGEIISVENDVTLPEGIIVQYPENGDYPILTSVPYAGTITRSVTKAKSGTATATFKKNGSSIGGTANSVSSTEDNETHSVDFDIGDDLSVTISSASGDLELAELRLDLLQRFNWLEYSGG